VAPELINDTELLTSRAREQVQTASELCGRLRKAAELAAIDLTAAQKSLLDAEKTLKRAQLLGSRFPHGWID